ncbi:MAG: hypothetical protein PF486_01240 [Prolixibacteraceae bacterium]|jgi:hypothetical protein|nr:hypothetical protein [Prolixibacteraceae bacterium]
MRIFKKSFDKNKEIYVSEVELVNAITQRQEKGIVTDEDKLTFDKIIKKHKNNPFIHQAYGMFLFRKNEIRVEALKHFKKAIELNIPDGGFSLMYATHCCFYPSGIVSAEAFDFLRTLMHSRDAIAESWNGPIMEDNFMDSTESGLKYYLFDLRCNKTYSDVYHAYAIVNDAFQCYYEALEAIEKAIELAPDNEELENVKNNILNRKNEG